MSNVEINATSKDKSVSPCTKIETVKNLFETIYNNFILQMYSNILKRDVFHSLRSGQRFVFTKTTCNFKVGLVVFRITCQKVKYCPLVFSLRFNLAIFFWGGGAALSF